MQDIIFEVAHTADEDLGTVSASGCCCCWPDDDDDPLGYSWLGAGEETSDKASEAAELREPAPDRSSPPTDVPPWTELIDVTPESLSSISKEMGPPYFVYLLFWPF